jgi:butyryl-CoA dehydrogenase
MAASPASQVLMKRAMTGVLLLIPAAMKLSEEVLASLSFEETSSGVFAEEERSLAQAKKVFRLAAGSSVQKFRDQLADQQEIVAALANIMMDVYAMDSSVRRAQKSFTARGKLQAGWGMLPGLSFTTRRTASRRRHAWRWQQRRKVTL